VLAASQAERDAFPSPKELWLDAAYDAAAPWDAYRYLGALKDRCTLQVGSTGTHAVKFLLAGARESWAVTPMLGEALCTQALAGEAGVAVRLRCVVAVAEELPFRSGFVDGAFSGGCLHHMVIETALQEIARVLRLGGKFAANDPWRAPLYRLGTAIFGRREPGESVVDRPLSRDRVGPAWVAFREARVIQHGTITRYPLLALNQLGVGVSPATAWNLGRVDDALCSMIPGMRGMGSSAAVLGTK
jgi:SAM-dependent methyltransferase